MDNSDLNRAIELQKNGKTTEARDLLIKILKENPRLPVAWMWLANTFPDNFNRIKVLTTCLRFNPDYTNAQKWLKLYKEQEEQRKIDPFEAELSGFRENDNNAKKQQVVDISHLHSQTEAVTTKEQKKGNKKIFFISTMGVLVLGFLAIVGLVYARNRGVFGTTFFPSSNLLSPTYIIITETPLLFTNTPKLTNTPKPTKTPQLTYTTRPTRTPADTPTPRFGPQTKTIGPIYDSLRETTYSIEITVTDIKWLSSDGYKTPKNGNEFLVVYIRATNLGPSSVQSFGSGGFQVLDSNGLLHDYTYLISTSDTCQLDYVDILPNGVLEGCVAFEVPIAGKIDFIYAPYQYEPLTPGRYLSVTLRN